MYTVRANTHNASLTLAFDKKEYSSSNLESAFLFNDDYISEFFSAKKEKKLNNDR